MAFSTQDQARLDALDAMLGQPQAPAPQPQAPLSIMGRIGEQAANLPINMGNALGNTVGDLLQMGVPAEDRSRMGDDPAGNFYNIPAARTTGESAVDLGANLVSQLPAYMIPETGIAKALGAARVPGAIARIAGAAGAGYLNTQGTEGQAGGAEQAGIMGTMSALGGLTRTGRLLPSLLLGGVAGGVASVNGATDNQALVQGSMVGLLGMIPGQHVEPRLPLGSEIPASGVRSVQPRFRLNNDPITGAPMDGGNLTLGDDTAQMQLPLQPGQAQAPGFRLSNGQPELSFNGTNGTGVSLATGDHPELSFDVRKGRPTVLDPADDPANMHPMDYIASEIRQGRQPSVNDIQRRYKLRYEDAERLLGQYRPGPIDLLGRNNGNVGDATVDRTADLAQQRLIGGDIVPPPDETSQPPVPLGPILQQPGGGFGRGPLPDVPTQPRFRLIGGEPGAYPHDVQVPVTPRIDMPMPVTPNFRLDSHPDLPFSGTPQPEPIISPTPTGNTRLLPFRESVTPTLPEGQSKLLLRKPSDVTQVVSTAIQHPDGRVLVGTAWDQPHEGVGIMHDMDSVDQSQRGFLVHDGDGTQRWVDRNEGLEVARQANQLEDPAQTTPLNSTDLTDRATVSEKVNGDVPLGEPPAEHPVDAPVETSQPAAAEEAATPVNHLERLRAFGADPNPYESLQQASPANRKLMFAAAREAGHKAGTIKKLAEVAKQLHDARVSEAPSRPKADAALSGEPDVLKADTSHFDPDTRDDIEFRRETINDPTTTADDRDYHTRKLREHFGLPDEQPVNLPGEDSPRLAQLRNAKPDVPSYSNLDETSQARLQGGHEDALDALERQNLSDEDNGKLSEFDPTQWEEEDKANKPKTPQTQMSDELRAILEDKDLDIDYHAAEAEHARLETEANDRASKASGQAEPEVRETEKVTKDVAKRNPGNKKASRAARRNSGLRLNQSEAGFVDAEMLAQIARYGIVPLGIGGPIGAAIDKENWLRGYIYGAALTGIGMHFGPKFIKMLMTDGVARSKAEFTNIRNVTSQPGAKAEDFLHNLAAQDAGATGDSLARYARTIQKAFTLSDDAREIMSRSNLSGMLASLRDALESMRGHYSQLSSAERDIYTEYAKKPGYVTDPVTKARSFNRAAETQFMNDMNAHPQFAAKAMVARKLRIDAQEMILNSMPDSALKNAIFETLGQYQTDSFRIFNEEKYRPTDAMIDKSVDELAYNGLFPGYDKMHLRKIVSSYLDGIYRNRALYTGGSGNARTLDQILHGKMKLDPKLEAKILAAVPGAKSVDEIVTSQRVLPKDLATELTKAISDGTYLTPAFRNMLGYYADPLEKEAATLTKLVPAARVAKQFELIASGTNKLGMKLAYTGEESSQLYATLQAKLGSAATDAERRLINAKLLDLRNRTPLPQSDSFGILSGKFVPTDLADTLPDMNKGMYGGSTNAVGRAVDQFNRFLKVGQTAMNPVSHIRQIMTTPLLGALAGTSPADIWSGFRVAASESKLAQKTMSAADRTAAQTQLARMRSLGIADTSGVNTEFNTQARQALTGYYDRTVMDKFLQTPVVSHIVEAYHYPDTALRIGTFLKHEQRMLSRFAPDVTAGRMTMIEASQVAEKEALRYTNRYTMNYANIPGGMAGMRKLPFVSLYLSYQYEIARIMKNITMDAIHGTGSGTSVMGNRMLAATKIASMAVVPFALEKMSVSNLSPQDQKDWEASRRMDQPYAQERYKYVMGRRPDGSFRYMDFSPLIPTDEWNRLFKSVADGSGQNILANNPVFGFDNTPALNVASELITGQSSRTGRAINTLPRALDAARQEVLPAAFGGYEFDNLMRALQANDEGGHGIIRMGSGKGYSIGDLLTTYATGLRPTTINPSWQKYTTVNQMTNQITTEKQYLMDTLRSNETQEAKQYTVKRYNDAVQLIVLHFHQKVMDQE